NAASPADMSCAVASTDAARTIAPIIKPLTIINNGIQRTPHPELVPPARRLEGALQRQQTFAPQLDLLPGEPHVVALRYRLFLELDAELVLFDSPFAGSLAAH